MHSNVRGVNKHCSSRAYVLCSPWTKTVGGGGEGGCKKSWQRRRWTRILPLSLRENKRHESSRREFARVVERASEYIWRERQKSNGLVRGISKRLFFFILLFWNRARNTREHVSFFFFCPLSEIANYLINERPYMEKCLVYYIYILYRFGGHFKNKFIKKDRYL